jgi:tetratricopeptide (TPR) repeat protein
MIEQNPEDVALLTLRGVALQGLGRSSDSADAFRAALSLKPDYFPALLALAKVEYATGDSAARTTLEKVLALRPEDAGAHAMLGAVVAEGGNCGEALTHFAQARPALDADLPARWLEAACLFETGRFTDAEAAYRRILQEFPDHSQAAFNLALTLFQRESYGEAIEILERARRAAPPAADLLSLLADAYEGANKTPEALEVLQGGVKLHPSEERLYLQLAELCVHHGSSDLANEVLDAGLDYLGESARLYSMRGVVQAQEGRFDEATRAFERAASLNADEEFTAMGLTLALQQGGRLEEAVEVLRERLRRNPGHASLNYMLARALIKQGVEPGQPEFVEAVHALELSVENDPRNARSRASLGELYLKRGDTAKAIEQLELAVEIDPSDSAAGYQLLLAFRKAGRDGEAAALMEKVQRLVANDRQRQLARNRLRLVRAERPNQP